MRSTPQPGPTNLPTRTRPYNTPDNFTTNTETIAHCTTWKSNYNTFNHTRICYKPNRAPRR
eukprot:5426562-Prorocentrum_lima.AAC.1